MSLTISSTQGKASTVSLRPNVTAPPTPPPAAAQVAATDIASASAPVAVEVPKTLTRISPKLAELAQRDKAARDSQRKWETEKAAWEAEKSKYISSDDLKKNPLKLLEQAGVTYDQLTQHAINTVDPVQNKLMTLEQKLADYEKRFQSIDQDKVTASQSQRDAAAKQIAYEAAQMSDNSPELEVFKAFGDEGHELVSKKIFDYYDSTGNLLDVAEAVKAVNAELTEELKTRFGSLSLFKQLTEPKVETPVQATQQTTTQARTLTNAMTPPSGRKFTSAEKRERAIRAMRGEKLD
jgi:hypothetical protein